MNVTPESRLALDPQLCLRNDVDRVVLLSRSRPAADRSPVFRLLHPSEAIVLALMDGDRTVRDLGLTWAELTDRTPEDGAAQVAKVLDYYTSGDRITKRFLVEVTAGNRRTIRRYDPLDFVISARPIDLKDRRLRRPYYITYLPTFFCPQKCVYCFAPTRPRPEADLIPLERLREIFAELAGLGVDVIQLSGGEPLARRDIFEIIEAIFAAGMAIDLTTKLGLGYEQALRLKALGLDELQISLDSADPEILDRMVGIRGYHRRIFKVLDDLGRAGLSVRVNTVLTPLNAPSLGDLIDYLGGLGHVTEVSLSRYGRSLFGHSNENFATASGLALAREQVEARRPRYPHMRISPVPGPGELWPKSKEEMGLWLKHSFCPAAREGFVILPDGRVTVCEGLYAHPGFIIGDLGRQSVLEVWNSPQALRLVYPDQAAVPDGPCKTCPDFVACNHGRGRCWRDVLKSYGWNRPYYPDPTCPRAPAGYRMA